MLYKPEKYKILKGPDSEISLCTCWFDPFVIADKFPVIVEKINLTGTLYSKEGVSILLRNLALNPNIRYLFLWNNTPLSRTEFGIAGFNLIKKVWQDPLSVNDLHKEIDVEVIQKIVSNVELVDLGDISFSDAAEFIKNFIPLNSAAYMSPIDFPEPKRDDSKPLSSEKVGFSVRGKTIYDAWLNTIDRVVRYGSVKNTEYGSLQRELQNISWTITNENLTNPKIPDLPFDVLKIIGLNEKSLNDYKSTLLDTKIPDGAAYTYGARLGSYSTNGFNQIDYIIQKLKESLITRRASATTMIPEFDSTQKSPPCLSLIQVLSDNDGKLNFFATFRSHDLFKAAIPNAYGLLNLQYYICEKVGVLPGILSINSISAHIYEEDWSNAAQILKCQKWENINTRFDEYNDIDERGIVRIRVEGSEIILDLMDLSGEVVFSFNSTSSRELIMKIAKLDLLSKSSHYADITIELVKAEISIKLDTPYIQDKPLKIKDFYLS